MSQLSYMDKNYEEIHNRIQQAASRVGREDVTLVAAVKYTDAEHINYLHRELGVNDVGENRVQQLLEHWETVDREGLRFHFIGTLQTNKVKYIVDKVSMIHSVDSLKLAKEIERQMAKLGKSMDVLVEINSGGEENKSGVDPNEAAELCLALRELPHVNLRGFMTMAPKCEDKSEYLKYFSLTKEIFDRLFKDKSDAILSMGMSESYEYAIMAGANMVRVGSAVFGERKYI